MTGKELIVYILKNNLENEEMFSNGVFRFLMDENEAAAKFKVGVETIKLWNMLGMIRGFELGDTLYFPKDTVDPITLNSKMKEYSNE